MGKIAQMLINLVVGLLTARYLGPSNYGLIHYAAAYTGFFSSFCTLGINSVIIKNFADHPQEEGEALGTTIVLRIASSFLSALMIVGIVALMNRGEPVTVLVAVLSSVGLLFQVFDILWWLIWQCRCISWCC